MFMKLIVIKIQVRIDSDKYSFGYYSKTCLFCTLVMHEKLYKVSRSTNYTEFEQKWLEIN